MNQGSDHHGLVGLTGDPRRPGDAVEVIGGCGAVDDAGEEITFEVEGLEERPLVGGPLCCAVPAAGLIIDELRSWPGVARVRLDAATGVATIVADQRLRYLEDMLEAIGDLGYAVRAVRRQPA